MQAGFRSDSGWNSRAAAIPRSVAAAAMILAGCAGMRDSLDQIRGVAPDDGSCSIVILEAGTSRVLSSQSVHGRFSVGLGLGDEYPRKVDITGVCNGKTVKFFGGIVPGSIGVTELGTVAP
jgi:hypothetical protein